MSKITTRQAISLNNLLWELKGPASYFTLFQAVQKRIMEVWPEIKSGPDAYAGIIDEGRELLISIEEKSALIYQGAEVFNDKNTAFIKREFMIQVFASIGKKVSEAFAKKMDRTPSENKVLSPSEIDDDLADLEDAKSEETK